MSLEVTFEQYYHQYQDMVYALCLGFSKGDQQIANDLAQETFIKVWAGLPKFEGRSSAKTWIYRICMNTCLLQVKKDQRRETQTISDRHEAISSEPETDKSHPELYHAIGMLNELDRIIIMLVLEGIPYDEMSEITGLTEGNLRVKVSRIKQKLNKILSHE